MALLEDMNKCCICECELHKHVGGVPAYYCSRCFEAHKADILANLDWVRFLVNLEKQRRKRRNRGRDGGYPVATVYFSALAGGRYG